MEIQWMSKKQIYTSQMFCKIIYWRGIWRSSNGFYMFLILPLGEHMMFVASGQVNAGSSNPIPNGFSHRYKKKATPLRAPPMNPWWPWIYEETNDFFQ